MIPGRPPSANVLLKVYLPPEIHNLTTTKSVLDAFAIISQRILAETPKEVLGELRRCVGDDSGEEERTYNISRSDFNALSAFAQKHNFGTPELASLLAWYSFSGDNQS